MSVTFKSIKFSTLVLLLQVAFIIIIGIFGDYQPNENYPKLHNISDDGSWEETPQASYPNFQDVNAMIFVGFGFLMTFLKSYGFGAVGLNLMVSAICVQWAAIVRGFIHNDIIGGEKFHITVVDMVTYDFATATVLISFGAVLGKVSPVQLVIMGIFEVLLAQINEYIGIDLLHVRDIGESMFIHTFGAYFGLAVARVLYTPDVEKSNKEGSVYHSDIFAMIGTVFLWIYWPSFNGGFADDQQQRDRAYLNTFLSLCACTAVTFAISSLVDKEGRLNMVHVQNSTLAGGVAVGASAQMPMHPFGAMIFGCVAGLISVLGYRFLTPLMRKYMKIHDTCGVNNLHGMPGLLAAIGAAVLAGISGSWSEHDRRAIFPETFDGDSGVEGALGRTPVEQGGYQFLVVVITFFFAIAGGTFTGFIMKLPIWNQPKDNKIFNDSDNWEVPEHSVPEPELFNMYKVSNSHSTPMEVEEKLLQNTFTIKE
uniref:Ammonium transporter AmtB-like domain-containing protein n=2 Tax=Biomphalaria glabrata TaxID=6526 RepID=A0A2C9JEJ5_BIOGL